MALGAAVVGAYLGTFLFSALRTVYYFAQDIQPNMSPMMFIVFSPVVGTGVAVVALFGEAILSRLWIRPRSVLYAFALGISYSSVLLFLIEPWLALVCLIVNPVVIRFLRPIASHPGQTANRG